MPREKRIASVGAPSYNPAPVAEKIELADDLSASPLWNADIAPTPLAKRTWNLWHIAALWIGMAVCIPTYMLGAGLLASGMTWWQAVVTITLGNLIVLVPMALNAHAGAKYGIPFPVFLRAPFGTVGSNIPALMRATVACGWFGIQTWIGGAALYQLAAVMAPSIAGSTFWKFAFFFLFWGINLFFILKGTESIKWLETWSAPILLAVGVGLLAWSMSAGGGLGRVLAHSDNFTRPTVTAHLQDGKVVPQLSPVTIDGVPRATAKWESDGRTITAVFDDGDGGAKPQTVTAPVAAAPPAPPTFWALFIPGLTAMVGFWATLALNIPDFTRFARSQRDQAVGQLLGLPTTMGFYSFVGIVSTCAALVVFPDILVTSQAPWDPTSLLARFKNPALVIGSMFFLAIATLTTNIAANVVSPANDLANLAPKHISFQTGGIITAVIGIVMMPWKLLESTDVYIFNWLISYSALLGPIAGIMIADYWIVRRRELSLRDLYLRDGRYGFIHWATVAILVAAILPNVPGFLSKVAGVAVPAFWTGLFNYAWFVGFAVAFVLYCAYGLWKRTETTSTASG